MQMLILTTKMIE